MINTELLNVTPKEYKVMLALFEYRGATIDQLLKILGYTKDGLPNMYKPIQSLTKLGYISAYATSPKRSKKLYFLSSKGYSKMLEQLSIPFEHRGKGFSNDFGDFPYNLYKPPNNLITHHLHLVEFLIEAKKLKDELNPENIEGKFDFRDNRYASRNYKLPIKLQGRKNDEYSRTNIFRPDAELLINSKTCFVEIDLGTERGKRLEDKFEGYKRFFDYLTSENQPLPSSVIFISEQMQNETQKNRRWQSIATKFLETLGEYATTVNLIFESIDQTQNVLLTEFNSQKYRTAVFDKLKEYNKQYRFKEEKLYFSISPSNIAFPFERVEGYETKGWALLWRFNEYINKNAPEQFKAILPVLYYHNNPPKPIRYFEKKDIHGYFNNRIHFKFRGNTGTWQNKDLLESKEVNPLAR